QLGTGLIAGQFAISLAPKNGQLGLRELHPSHSMAGDGAGEGLLGGGADAGGHGVLLAWSSALFYPLTGWWWARKRWWWARETAVPRRGRRRRTTGRAADERGRRQRPGTLGHATEHR